MKGPMVIALLDRDLDFRAYIYLVSPDNQMICIAPVGAFYSFISLVIGRELTKLRVNEINPPPTSGKSSPGNLRHLVAWRR